MLFVSCLNYRQVDTDSSNCCDAACCGTSLLGYTLESLRVSSPNMSDLPTDFICEFFDHFEGTRAFSRGKQKQDSNRESRKCAIGIDPRSRSNPRYATAEFRRGMSDLKPTKTHPRVSFLHRFHGTSRVPRSNATEREANASSEANPRIFTDDVNARARKLVRHRQPALEGLRKRSSNSRNRRRRRRCHNKWRDLPRRKWLEARVARDG